MGPSRGRGVASMPVSFNKGRICGFCTSVFVKEGGVAFLSVSEESMEMGVALNES